MVIKLISHIPSFLHQIIDKCIVPEFYKDNSGKHFQIFQAYDQQVRYMFQAIKSIKLKIGRFQSK